MKLAIIIQCHKNPEQINMLLDALHHPSIDFFVHVDAKSDIKKDLYIRDGIHFLPNDKRVDVKWANFSQVQATLNLLEFASAYDKYDFFCLISGQDFPIKPVESLMKFLENNIDKNFVNLSPSKNYVLGECNSADKRVELYYPQWLLKTDFIHKVIRRLYIELSGGYNHTFNIFRRKDICEINFYTGSSWWCFNNEFTQYLLNYINDNPKFIKIFNNSNCPDEHIFQTILMNSPYANTREDYLHYIDWTGCKNSPNVLTIKDFDNIKNSEKFFARKFDIDVDKEVTHKIIKEILI